MYLIHKKSNTKNERLTQYFLFHKLLIESVPHTDPARKLCSLFLLLDFVSHWNNNFYADFS